MLAVLSPGQGSQKPGFLTPWLDLPGAEARLRWWSALAGVDLVHLGTEADADEIKDTARTQPLLVAAALLAAEHLPMYDVSVVAGHSVGELGAAALAGVLPAEAAITLAGVRGREMAAACALEPTGMAAVLGGDPDEVIAAIEAHGLYPANRNGAGQIVAAGALDRLEKLAADPPAGARVIDAAGRRRVPHPVHGPGRAGPRRHRRRHHPDRPGPAPAVQPGRRRGQPRPGHAAAPGPAGDRAGALGPVHGHPGRPRRDRGDRAATGRHPRRPDQARTQGHRGAGDRHPQHPGRPARRPRPDRPARHGAQPRTHPAVPGGGRRQRRYLRTRRRPRRGRLDQVRAGHRSRRHPAGSGRGGRALRRGAHRMARPPDDPVAPGQPLARIGGQLS